MGEHSLRGNYAITSGCYPICFRLTYNQCSHSPKETSTFFCCVANTPPLMCGWGRVNYLLTYPQDNVSFCQRYFSLLLLCTTCVALKCNRGRIGTAFGLTRTNVWISHIVHCEVWWWNFYTAFTHFSRSPTVFYSSELTPLCWLYSAGLVFAFIYSPYHRSSTEYLVLPAGVEPATPGSSDLRSTNWAKEAY